MQLVIFVCSVCFLYFLVIHSSTNTAPALPDAFNSNSFDNHQSTSVVSTYPLNLQEDRGTSSIIGHNSFKIVIDNIDMSVKSRFMRVDTYRNKSLHYVNSYAVLGRINFSELPDVHPHTCSNRPDKNALLLLPSVDDDKSMRRLFMTHVARVLVTNIKYFKLSFDDIVEWHITHSYHEEMSAKSTVVSNISSYMFSFVR